jgi:hypothetical protein
LSSVVILAQPSATLQGSPPVNADDRVLNAPYSAQRRFTYDEKSANVSINRTESGGSKARDSKGRTYSADERHWTYLGSIKSEMLYEIDDPVAHTDTRWDSTSKIVRVVHTPQNVPGKESLGAQTLAFVLGTHEDPVEAAMIDAGALVEKLGAKTIGGVVAEGTRTSRNDKGTVVVHESWYCPELKIVILTIHDDPRSGSSRDELVDIVRGEPDVRKYQPPADYVVRDIQLP